MRPSWFRIVADRAIDIVVFGMLVAVAVRASSEFERRLLLAAAALLLLGWVVVWRRRK